MDEVIKYEVDDLGELDVLIVDNTVWLTQAQMAELFQTTRANVTMHIRNVFKENELNEDSTCKDFLHMGNAGKQGYRTKHYNLDVIISIGYRIKSFSATKFRIWATNVLREHLLKGYTVRQPATIEQLRETELRIEAKLKELRSELEQQIEGVDVVANAQFDEIYQALIDLVSKKQLQEQQPRRKIGFQHYLEPKN